MNRLEKYTVLGVIAAGLFAAFSTLGASAAQAGTFVCSPQEVAYFENRVHVLCINSTFDRATGATIRYIAVPVADPAAVAMLTSFGTAGFAFSRGLRVTFQDGDLSGEEYGCIAGDCRRPLSIVFE